MRQILKNIERKILSQIHYNSKEPYQIITFYNKNWENKYNPRPIETPPKDIYIEVSHDFSSVLVYYQNTVTQYFLQDGHYYTKMDYEQI